MTKRANYVLMAIAIALAIAGIFLRDMGANATGASIHSFAVEKDGKYFVVPRNGTKENGPFLPVTKEQYMTRLRYDRFGKWLFFSGVFMFMANGVIAVRRQGRERNKRTPNQDLIA